MPTDAALNLVELLQRHRLFEPAQLAALPELQQQFPDPRMLAKELVARRWLTTYQANQLVAGNVKNLVLGPYALLEKLGEGGMGQVFKARHQRLGRIDAVKLIRKERLDRPDAIKRFYREIKAAAALKHPNIVHAYDADEVAGTHYFAMEYVEGTDLAAVVKQRGPLPIGEACEYIRQAALGLQHAFERGLVHRDIKPHNLLLASGGRKPAGSESSHRQHTEPGGSRPPLAERGIVKILDLGLARLDAGPADDKSSTMTHEGTVMGTPDYIAPEQARSSHEVDIRADIYSLGCTFYFLLTGRVPFPGGSLTEKLLKHQLEEPTPVELLRPETSAEVAAILTCMMAKNAEDRFQTPAEVVDRLSAVGDRPSASNQPGGSRSETFAQSDLADSRWPTADSRQDKTMPLVERLRRKRLASQKRFEKQFFLAAGIIAGVLIVGFALFMLIRSLDKEPPAPPPEVAKETRKKPAEKKPERPPTPEELEREFQAKRAAEAEAAYPALEAKFKASGEPGGVSPRSFESFAKEVAAFKAKHGGTPAALKAAARLMELPSPLDHLDPKKLPEDCIAHWRAAGREPPGELVGVLGEHRGRHWGGARCVVIHPKNEWFATAGEDGLIRVWSMETHLEIGTLQGHRGPIVSLAVSPDGRLLASASGDGTARLWDVKIRRELKQLTYGAPPLAFAHDGKSLLMGAGANIMKWDIERDAPPTELFKGHKRQVVCLALSEDGKYALSGAAHWSDDPPTPLLKLWHLESGQEVKSFNGHKAKIHSCAIAPDGKLIASGSNDGTIRVWNRESGLQVREFNIDRQGSRNPYAMTFQNDSTQLLVAFDGGIVELWDIAKGAVLRSFKGHHQADVLGLALSSNRDRMATASMDGTVRLWDVETGKEVQPLTGPVGACYPVAFSPDCRSLMAGHSDGSLQLWDTVGTKVHKKFPGHKNEVHCIDFTPDGKRAISCGHDGAVRLWDVESGAQIAEFVHTEEHNLHPQVWRAFLTPDGSRAVVGTGAQAYLLRLGLKIEAERLPVSGAAGLAVSPDGRTAFAGVGADLSLVDLNSKRLLSRADDPSSLNRSIAAFPDGIHVLTGGNTNPSDNNVALWDVRGKNWKEVAKLPGHKRGVPWVTVSPDGRLCAASGDYGLITVWDVATRSPLKSWALPGHVSAVAFAADGRHLATANGNGTVYILRIAPPPAANAAGSPLTPEQAKQQQADAAKALGVPVTIENSIGMKLNLIPAGKFLMGSPEDEPGRNPNEGPQHEVTITKPFHIGVYEVTQAEYEKVMGTNPSHFNKANGGGPDHPVEVVSWDDAVAFCKKLSELPDEKKAGRVYRLPTEAEWEYACRAGTRTAYSFGDDANMLGEYAWFRDNSQATHPVGQKSANRWGLYDMHGNVWEWIADRAQTPYQVGPPMDPKPLTTPGDHGARGGSFKHPWASARSAHRGGGGATFRDPEAGFRVVCDYRPPAERSPK